MTEKNTMILKFGKPYSFEGEEFDEIDLSGLEDVSANDMIKAQKLLTKEGSVEVIPEMTLQFACILAAQVTSRPLEFYTQLPAREAIKLKNLVTGFLYGAE